LAAGLLGTLVSAALCQPIQPTERPGDLPDFKKAEERYNRSASFRTDSFWLGYAYYTKAVAGYRLAQYWLNQGRNNPDVQTGYRDAQTNVAKAEKAWKTARAEYEQKQHRQGVQACDEMLRYAQNLADHVNKGTGGPPR
jgi:hypothetical protein